MLTWANGVEHGLASSVWTKDVSRAIRMSNQLDFGCVWINRHLPLVAEMPHGGFKSSGHGEDLSIDGLEDYTRIKHVMVYTDCAPRAKNFAFRRHGTCHAVLRRSTMDGSPGFEQRIAEGPVKRRTRVWICLSAVCVLAVSLGTLAAVWNDPAERTSHAPPTSTVEPQWREERSASGKYVAQFPAEPTAQTETAVNGLTAQITQSVTQDIAFILQEMPLNGTAPLPLDEVVDKHVEGTRAALASSSGATVTATQISRTAGNFEGVETRIFHYELIFGELIYGHTRAIMGSVVFYRNEVLIQASVIGEADAATVERFLTSLRPNVG